MEKTLTEELPMSLFVTSFGGDALGPWRAYGDDGRGFALGFAATVFESADRSLVIRDFH
jgi:hypothetical protein